MTARQFKKGEILFHQGDASDRVMLVKTGEVEVMREVEGATVLLGHVHEGEWLGEISVIENRNRGATARAVTDCEVVTLTAQKFLEWVSSDPVMARDLIRRLSARLREVVETLEGERSPLLHDQIVDGDISDHSTIALVAQSDSLRSRIGAVPIPVARLPYLVGRVPIAGEDLPSRPPDLSIGDAQPFRLSRQHFMIARIDNHLVVSDIGSALGTMVNGRGIGYHFMKDSAPLHRGENQVVAGGHDSPFAFLVSVN
jgi:CRP/FNR family cyclic AMP-dependent transcriptional regulator